MPTRPPRALAAFVAAAACLAAADCSNNNNPLSGMSAKQVTAKAIADLKSAPNFAMTGSAVSGGHTFSLDLGFKGKECAGTIGEGPAGSIGMVAIGSTVWLKPDAAF